MKNIKVIFWSNRTVLYSEYNSSYINLYVLKLDRNLDQKTSILFYVNFKVIINESEHLTLFVRNSMYYTGNKL